MPEVHPDHFATQYPNRHNPAEFWYVPSASSFFAILGGVFAALSSVTAKLTVDLNSEYVASLLSLLMPAAPRHVAQLASRSLLVASTVACNFFMWLFFTKALRYSSSTARAVTLQTVSNFATTAVCGTVLFGDTLALQWWAGVSLIAVGLAILNSQKTQFECEDPDHLTSDHSPDNKKSH
ncbi:hypothetical protein EV183_000537 [Coemansia sp. RSA 2336]|nr:hypothetical protein EV183_000537 [Coemansia sp. RSA 2336]